MYLEMGEAAGEGEMRSATAVRLRRVVRLELTPSLELVVSTLALQGSTS